MKNNNLQYTAMTATVNKLIILQFILKYNLNTCNVSIIFMFIHL